MKIIQFVFGLITFALLASCGSGGDTTLARSQFIDSPVQGLYYVSSTGVTGTTDENGYFNFSPGDSVTFKIGGANGLTVGESTPKPNAPVLVTEFEAGNQIAQILQTFNTHDDPSAKLDL